MKPMPEALNAHQNAQDAAWGAFRPVYGKVCAKRENGAQNAPEAFGGQSVGIRDDVELKIEYVPLESLNPSATNSNVHTHDQIDQIAESIGLFGNCDPIGVGTDEDGELTIIEGHGRYYALKKLGRTEAPVIFLDHLGPEEKREYAILHNQLTRNSEFDMAILEKEFEAMPDFDWEGFGFDDSFFEDSQFETVEQSPKSKEVHFDDTLGVFVQCTDEDDQERVYEELIERGFECRLLTL